MKKYYFLIFILSSLTSYGQDKMKTNKNLMNQFEQFKAKEKFVEDMSTFYPGIADPKLKPVLTNKINLAADDFKEVAESNSPTTEKYQEKIGIGLKRFSELYIQLDTEDRERICGYFEELMDIVGLESSAGQLNTFMYGFDPTSKN